MSSDQSELGQARRERDEAEARFNITFDANPAPSMIVQLENAQVVVTNGGFHEVSGRNNHEVNGRLVRDLELFNEEEDFERILELLRRGESTTKETLVMVSRTKGERTMLVSAKPIELDAGRCGIFTFADVTELKEAVEATRRSEQRFFQAFHLAPIPVTLSTLGKGETFLEVNQAFIELTGYTREEIIGKGAFDLNMWSSREDRQKLQEVNAANQGFRELELQLQHKDGDVYDILLSAEIIGTDGDRRYLKMFYDITERKRNEAQMHQAVQSIMNDASWFSQELIARLNHIRAGAIPRRMKRLS